MGNIFNRPPYPNYPPYPYPDSRYTQLVIDDINQVQNQPGFSVSPQICNAKRGEYMNIRNNLIQRREVLGRMDATLRRFCQGYNSPFPNASVAQFSVENIQGNGCFQYRQRFDQLYQDYLNQLRVAAGNKRMFEEVCSGSIN